MRRSFTFWSMTGAALSVGACALLVDTTGLVGSEPDNAANDGAAIPMDGSLAEGRGPNDAATDAGPTPAPSCQGASGPGISLCGPDGGENCCSSPLLPGGTFRRSFDGKNNIDGTYPATVTPFRLDRFEVTVGRFRGFVAASSAGWKPKAGAGRHNHLPGGGLVQVGGILTEAGWDEAWSDKLASTQTQWSAALNCDLPQNTWSDQPGINDAKAINCITWYQAYAFCIWDGGFLPSETEWNFAAAGGDQQRILPWSTPPDNSTINCSYANYGDYDAGSQCYAGVLRSGEFSPKSDGRWSQADLAGNVLEWTLDSFHDYANPCIDCVNLLPAAQTTLRGGAFYAIPGAPYGNSRLLDIPTRVSRGGGVRCARAP